MGLFSNNKKLCPVCGSATPRLLATKVEGMPICSKCADKIDMRQELRNNLTLSQLESYLEFFEENQPLKDEFNADFEKRTGFLKAAAFLCDFSHNTFKLSGLDNGIVYEPSAFKSLVISQDGDVVIELTKDALVIHNSDVPDYIRSLKSEVDAYNGYNVVKDTIHEIGREIRRSDEIRRAQEAGERFDEFEFRANESEREREAYERRPDFRPNVPFKKWQVTVEVDHPWGAGISDSDNQVWFDGQNPSINDCLDNYYNMLAQYKEMAMAFRTVCCPNCQIIDQSVQATVDQNIMTQTAVSPVEEIKKYKELLDAGIITEEEFAVKKRQLMGI